MRRRRRSRRRMRRRRRRRRSTPLSCPPCTAPAETLRPPDSRGRRDRERSRTWTGCTVLAAWILYCTVLYCTVLYCTVLYCTVQSVSLLTQDHSSLHWCWRIESGKWFQLDGNRQRQIPTGRSNMDKYSTWLVIVLWHHN